MRFWDTSAIVPLLLAQPSSASMDELYRADQRLVVWWATRVECESALSREERLEHLRPRAARAARQTLDQLAATWQEMAARDALRETARRLLRTHDLRAADALQLAAALFAAEQRPQSLPFVCLDERLGRAAEKEGFAVSGLS